MTWLGIVAVVLLVLFVELYPSPFDRRLRARRRQRDRDVAHCESRRSRA